MKDEPKPGSRRAQLKALQSAVDKNLDGTRIIPQESFPVPVERQEEIRHLQQRYITPDA